MTDDNLELDNELRAILGDEDWKYTDKPYKLRRYIDRKVREGQLEILRGFRRRDFVRDDFYEIAVIERLATLAQEQEDLKG